MRIIAESNEISKNPKGGNGNGEIYSQFGGSLGHANKSKGYIYLNFPKYTPATRRGYIKLAVWRITLILQKIFDIIFIQGKEITKANAL